MHDLDLKVLGNVMVRFKRRPGMSIVVRGDVDHDRELMARLVGRMLSPGVEVVEVEGVPQKVDVPDVGIVVVADPDLHGAFGFPEPRALGRVGVWTSEHGGNFGLVLLAPRFTEASKTAMIDLLYMVKHGHPWDEVGSGECLGVDYLGRGCKNGVTWLDERGMPYCKGHEYESQEVIARREKGRVAAKKARSKK